MYDVKKKFMPRFTELAKQRIRTGLRVAGYVAGDQALAVARELHSLAGEAGLLGLDDLVPLARVAEQAATQLHTAREEPQRVALEQALLHLHAAVRSVERELGT